MDPPKKFIYSCFGEFSRQIKRLCTILKSVFPEVCLEQWLFLCQQVFLILYVLHLNDLPTNLGVKGPLDGKCLAFFREKIRACLQVSSNLWYEHKKDNLHLYILIGVRSNFFSFGIFQDVTASIGHLHFAKCPKARQHMSIRNQHSCKYCFVAHVSLGLQILIIWNL